MNSIDMLPSETRIRLRRETRKRSRGRQPHDRAFLTKKGDKWWEGHEGPMTLTVTGALDPDGKFKIESISPAGGGEEEPPMPGMQPSPS